MAGEQNQVSILVVEGRRGTAMGLKQTLMDQGFSVTVCRDRSQALEAAAHSGFDLAFVPEILGGQDCADLVANIMDRQPEAIVTVMSSSPSVDGAVQAMRLGAFDYVDQPGSEEDLTAIVQSALDFRRLRLEGAGGVPTPSKAEASDRIIGQSPPMQEIFRLIDKVARTDSTVLVLGDSGTGKELVARAIHYQSDRSTGPLVPVNCGAIPTELLESELFGHEKGAFTGAVKSRLGRFELAEGGTIFLDEIGDMSPMLQVKLLRVLQDHQFERVGGTKTITADIRVIAATNQDLKKKVEEISFREDLYYRLNVIPIRIPPLRERKEDIPLLAQFFLERLERTKGLGVVNIDPRVMEMLVNYSWPGNVRELENLMERMVILAEGDTIRPEEAPQKLTRPAAGAPDLAPLGLQFSEEGIDFNAAVDAFERQLIDEALRRTGGVKNRAAALLRLNRTTLVEKIKKKGLAPAPA